MKSALFAASLLAGASLAFAAAAQPAPGGGGGGGAPPGPPPVVASQLPQTQTNGTLRVTSSAISGGKLADANTGFGGNRSPALAWAGAPAGTKSFVLIAEDAGAGRNGTPILHWLAYNIPANVTSLPEGVPPGETVATVPGMMQGGGGGGGGRGGGGGAPAGAAPAGPPPPPPAPGFRGPRPPAGMSHDYHFQIFALDTTITPAAGNGRDPVLAAMQGHVLAKGEVVGAVTGPPAPAGGAPGGGRGPGG